MAIGLLEFFSWASYMWVWEVRGQYDTFKVNQNHSNPFIYSPTPSNSLKIKDLDFSITSKNSSKPLFNQTYHHNWLSQSNIRLPCALLKKSLKTPLSLQIPWQSVLAITDY